MVAQPPDVAARPRRDPVRTSLQVVPVLVFVGTCLAVVRYALQPITNPDTYFHLRFGSEFLNGWSLRDPGTVTPFATRSGSRRSGRRRY